VERRERNWNREDYHGILFGTFAKMMTHRRTRFPVV
jgi:hypothetical protein